MTNIMKTNLVILGSGPRGIASTIQALKYKDKFNIYLIDPDPISTWKFPNMVTNMKMRSPITFDLVTYQEDLNKYKLSNFLGETVNVKNQKDIEDCDTYCLRKEFVDYLRYCLEEIVKEGVTLIKRKPFTITSKNIEFSNSTLNYDYLIVATGKASEELIIPNYLKGLNPSFCKDIYNQDWLGKNIYVVGSGQFSAEIVDYLTDNVRASVKWVRNKELKLDQFPSPSFKDWGAFSALGNHYYNNLNININGLDYIKLVKNWGPTITPFINSKLIAKKNKFGIIKPEDLILNKDNIYVLASGKKQNLYKLPFDFRLPNSKVRENVPVVTKAYNNNKYKHIYFTGLLALEVGGPQQGSIISSGETARTIMDSIVSGL